METTNGSKWEKVKGWFFTTAAAVFNSGLQPIGQTFTGTKCTTRANNRAVCRAAPPHNPALVLSSFLSPAKQMLEPNSNNKAVWHYKVSTS